MIMPNLYDDNRVLKSSSPPYPELGIPRIYLALIVARKEIHHDHTSARRRRGRWGILSFVEACGGRLDSADQTFQS
jgi:hypothetical protein